MNECIVKDATLAMDTVLDGYKDNLSYTASVILNNYFLSINMRSKVVCGYLNFGDGIYIRHIWCNVGGIIADPGTTEDMVSITKYVTVLPINFDGPILGGGNTTMWNRLKCNLDKAINGESMDKIMGIKHKTMELYEVIDEKFKALLKKEEVPDDLKHRCSIL